ncbi:MAG: BMP family protein [Anaerolineales bacterium]|jgi:basic membrane lipoprotein Med (substrate-binding protein (PBP1-ABC) superfamily)
MKTKVFQVGVLFLLLAFFVSACAPAATPAPQEPAPQEPAPQEPAPAEPLKVAVIMPSSITDYAFSQSFYEGLKIVQEEMGGEGNMEIAFSEGMFNVPDAAAAIRDYAATGYDIVFAHGSQYGTSLAQIAPDFPETAFAWGTSLDTFQAQGVTNVHAYQAEAQEGGFVMGVIAALMSESGVLGIAGPVEAGDAKLYVDGFAHGAKYARPDVTVNITYTGSFSDVSLMAAAANTHISAGADMLTGSSQSVVGAIGVAKDNGAYWFGTQWDQSPIAPETVVASQIFDWTGIIKDIIDSASKGVLGGKAYTLTFKNEGLVLKYNDAVPVADEIKAAAADAIQGIMDGEIDPLPY